MSIKYLFKDNFYGKAVKEKNTNLTVCVFVLCFIDPREFTRDKDSFTSAALSIIWLRGRGGGGGGSVQRPPCL